MKKIALIVLLVSPLYGSNQPTEKTQIHHTAAAPALSATANQSSKLSQKKTQETIRAMATKPDSSADLDAITQRALLTLKANNPDFAQKIDTITTDTIKAQIAFANLLKQNPEVTHTFFSAFGILIQSFQTSEGLESIKVLVKSWEEMSKSKEEVNALVKASEKLALLAERINYLAPKLDTPLQPLSDKKP